MQEVKWNWPSLYKAFSLLSDKRVLWLGKWGYGATKPLLRACRREGTTHILNRLKEQCSALEGAILDNLMVEGMVFASYDSLLTHLSREGYQAEDVEDERLISDIRYWIYRREEKGIETEEGASRRADR
jgi:hypothetical protein